MNVLVMKFYIYIEESKSLKDKRRIVKSIIEKTRDKFKVSISEVDQLENLNYSTVGLVSVSNSSQFLNSLSQNIENFIDQYYPGRIQKTERWIENVD
jgi:hypothetical protein